MGMITRPEVVRRVNAAGGSITLGSLRGWEDKGYLPSPIVKGRPVRALYPESAVEEVLAVALSRRGKSMPDPSPDLAPLLADDAHSFNEGRQAKFAEITYRDAAGRLCGRRIVDLGTPF